MFVWLFVARDVNDGGCVGDMVCDYIGVLLLLLLILHDGLTGITLVLLLLIC